MNPVDKNTEGGQNSRFIGGCETLPGYRRWASHDYAGWGYYMITFSTEPRRKILSRIENYQAVLTPSGKALEDAWLKMAEECPQISLREYAVMPDHFHGVVVMKPGSALPFGWLTGSVGEKEPASDVIRHEFGHALADRYPAAFKKGRLFRETFGGVYSDKPAPDIDPDNWEFDCVSKYAASATREDFAETFMLFVKHKGKIPAQFKGKPVILKKWKAVAEIVKRVAAATR